MDDCIFIFNSFLNATIEKGQKKKGVQIEFYRSKEEKALLSENRGETSWEQWRLNFRRRRKRQGSGQEDRRGEAVLGELWGDGVGRKGGPSVLGKDRRLYL